MGEAPLPRLLAQTGLVYYQVLPYFRRGLADVLHASARAYYWAEAGHLYHASAKDRMKRLPGRADRLITP